jgi:hypothetical protein
LASEETSRAITSPPKYAFAQRYRRLAQGRIPFGWLSQCLARRWTSTAIAASKAKAAPQAAAVPVVGGFGKPSIEALTAQKPNYIFSVDLEDQSLPLLFTRLGWRSERIPCSRLDDIPDAVLAVGPTPGP